MPDLARARSSVRTAVVWEVLRAALADLPAQVRVLDVGGGTGGFAVPLAELGHEVTVLEPSPDALASLHRRAADAGVDALVRPVQGDEAGLAAFAGDEFDLVLCHGALEHADDPAAAIASIARVVRPQGLVSVLAANRHAAVLARASSGQLAAARHILDDPDGRWGPRDPLPRRFDPAALAALVSGAGLTVVSTHGVRVFSDLVPGAVVEGEAALRAELLALESAVADHPVLAQIAAQLHVLARRP
ncbi:MAG: methyltransferase domain-containing protein [Sporichthyaceae bacterium]